jgi:small subunit ribosomal protein S6
MRRYETIFIVDPDISEEERTPLFEKITELMPQQNGLLVELDEWGTKKMAYEIKKRIRGYYVRLDYCGTGALVDEIERLFRIDERILKYMTILLEKNVELEKIKEEIATKEAETNQVDNNVESEVNPGSTDTLEPETVEEGTIQTKSEEEGL